MPVCVECQGKCKTCSDKADFCTSCAPGFILDEAVGECVKVCSFDDSRVELDGKCVNCESPCTKCENRVDYCLLCDDGLTMHDYKCVEECPDQYERRDDGRCVLTGFFCRFGYEMNAAGDACFLMA